MKNIVICCDGTGNEYGENNTNVVETYEIAHKNSEQVAFYDPGVGTGGFVYSDGKKPGEHSLTALGDQATGSGLRNNVNDAYRYLMDVFEDGDKVFLFGFSRGAFTVRALAGMLNKVGLLSGDQDNLLPYASKLYNIEDNVDIARGFKSTFSRSCPVHLIGVWDTVASLLMSAGQPWYDSSLNHDVSFGYQALAIDEQRKDFPPSIWRQDNLTGQQTVEQVWFAGVHSDVGGWYDERGLSNIALHWMLEKAAAQGLLIDRQALARREQNPHDDLHNSRTGLWRIRGKHVRTIPKHSRVHASVFKRKRRAGNKYDPKNLGKRSDYIVVE